MQRRPWLLLALGCLCLSAACVKRIPDGAREIFAEKQSCPAEQVQVEARPDVTATQAIPQPPQPAPPEVAANPEKLQAWNQILTDRETATNASQSVYELQGCGKHLFYVCHHPNASDYGNGPTVGDQSSIMADTTGPHYVSAVQCLPATHDVPSAESLPPGSLDADHPQHFGLGVGLGYGGVDGPLEVKGEVKPISWLALDLSGGFLGGFGTTLSEEVRPQYGPNDVLSVGLVLGATQTLLNRSNDPNQEEYGTAPFLGVFLDTGIFAAIKPAKHLVLRANVEYQWVLNGSAYHQTPCPSPADPGICDTVSSLGPNPWALASTGNDVQFVRAGVDALFTF